MALPSVVSPNIFSWDITKTLRLNYSLLFSNCTLFVSDKEEVENINKKENNVALKQNNLFIISIKFPKTVKLY